MPSLIRFLVVVLVLGGTNDLGTVDPTRTVERLQAMHAAAANAGAVVGVLSIPVHTPEAYTAAPAARVEVERREAINQALARAQVTTAPSFA